MVIFDSCQQPTPIAAWDCRAGLEKQQTATTVVDVVTTTAAGDLELNPTGLLGGWRAYLEYRQPEGAPYQIQPC